MYTSDKHVSTIINSLRHEFPILPKRFYDKFMVLNTEKFSFMLLGVDDSLQINLVCGNEILKNTKQGKVLGVTLDNQLKFATHSLNITKNANKKLNTLMRVQNT